MESLETSSNARRKSRCFGAVNWPLSSCQLPSAAHTCFGIGPPEREST